MSESILQVQIHEAKPNPMFTEEERAIVRFLRYSRKVKCPICEGRAKIHWTMLCEFRALTLNENSFVPEKSDVLPPLTNVCNKHPLEPAFPAQEKEGGNEQTETITHMRTIVLLCITLLLTGCEGYSYPPHVWSGADSVEGFYRGLAVADSFEEFEYLALDLHVSSETRQRVGLRRRQWYVDNHNELSERTRGDILKGNIRLGMTSEQVRASCGGPNRNNRTVNRFGTREQWVYGSHYKATYLYFEDGILMSWQN